MEVKHEDLEVKKRFYLLVNEKEIGEMTYKFINDNVIDINHTYINQNYRGKDLGLKLVKAAADYMRKNNIKAIPSCPYVEKVFKENSQYTDLIV